MRFYYCISVRMKTEKGHFVLEVLRWCLTRMLFGQTGTMGTASLLVLRSQSQRAVVLLLDHRLSREMHLQLATLTSLMAFRMYTISVFVVNDVGRNIKGGFIVRYRY